ncbi:MAG: RNA-binding cell elongation regulator Jag/EloR [Anaerolineales bacterium]|jgi:spoIIIJ-associated protein
MDDKRTSLEMIAPTIEEAIAKGLEELNLPEEAVDIDILDIGSQGLFGLGSRQARVRLTVKDPDATPKKGPQVAGIKTPVESQEAESDLPQEQDLTEEVAEIPDEDITQLEMGDQDISEPGAQAAAVSETVNEEVVLHVAQVTVEELLEKMGFVATVNAYHGEPDDERSRVPLMVDITGDDLSILIGPRAETLNALQYISSLIIGKELGHSVPLVVDVEGYRKRRAQQLQRLAEKMADQAVKSGRRQLLEPMPANERRLVHIALRENPEVETESIGEEPRRKVTIIPIEREIS